MFLTTDSSSDITIDFGFNSPCSGSIGDFVWNDLNRNGIQDAGEPGLNGVTLQLLNGVTIVATTTTAMVGNVNGGYLFSGLCAGTYSVKIVEATVPAGFVATTANAPGYSRLNSAE